MRLILASIVLLAALFAASLAVGASDVSLAQLLSAAAPDHELARTVYLDLRLPRALCAALCGGALAVAGVLAQGLFRESLASPTVIGTEAGGSLAAALAFYFGAAFMHWLALPLTAFVGALGASVVVMAIAGRASTSESGGPRVATLLLAGFAMNALLGAGTSLFVTLSLEDPQRAATALAWLVGGLAARGWEHVAIGGATLVLGSLLAIPSAPRLDVLSLGEETATSLAVDVRKLRRIALGGMAVLVAGAVSIAGAIPFVGLVVPHAARRLAGPSHARLMVVSGLNGASLVLVADLLARTVRAPAETPAGILTAFIGAPFFLALLLRKQGRVGA